jgi:spore coat polysaccharide biosynthesis protein SpsF
MGSTRLPGKVLKPLCGQSVLAHVVERVRSAHGVDAIVVATSTLLADDVIASEAGILGARVFRGSEVDVLSRFDGAAREVAADIVVRVTADCPLFDGSLLAFMLERFGRSIATGQTVDYLSNTLVRTYPRGLDAEIFTAAALRQAHDRAREDFEREHVTPYIYRHPELFRCENYTGTPDRSRYRWTLDTEEDWRLIEAVYAALWQPARLFSSDEVIDLLQREPAIVALNAHVEQKTIASPA